MRRRSGFTAPGHHARKIYSAGERPRNFTIEWQRTAVRSRSSFGGLGVGSLARREQSHTTRSWSKNRVPDPDSGNGTFLSERSPLRSERKVARAFARGSIFAASVDRLAGRTPKKLEVAWQVVGRPVITPEKFTPRANARATSRSNGSGLPSDREVPLADSALGAARGSESFTRQHRGSRIGFPVRTPAMEPSFRSAVLCAPKGTLRGRSPADQNSSFTIAAPPEEHERSRWHRGDARGVATPCSLQLACALGPRSQRGSQCPRAGSASLDWLPLRPLLLQYKRMMFVVGTGVAGSSGAGGSSARGASAAGCCLLLRADSST